MNSSCLLILAVLLPVVFSSRILAVFPTVSKSHFDFFEPLLLALAARGHEVTVVNSYPQDPPVQNYTDISLKEFKHVFFNNIPFNNLPRIPSRFEDSLMFLYSQIEDNERTFNHPDLQELFTSDVNFDLILVELWNSDVFLGFAEKFKVPIVAMSSSALLPWGSDRFGLPDNPSYINSIFLEKMGQLDFYQRISNCYQVAASKLSYAWFFNPLSERIARRNFGDSMTPLDVLARNSSLLLLNTHHSLHGIRPLTPQVVQVGGLHVKDPRPLPKELDQWMNESPLGVVYFSFGSMLRGATLPADKVKSFLQVFATLKQRVLWKWEDDTVDNLPSNVKIMKWLPQRDILGHPKTRVFISHGGLLGTTEAVVSGVPILGIPMYGDQPNNVAALVENRVAIHIDYNNISVESLSYALNTLLNDNSYTENAKQLSRRFLDRPMSPLDTAVYWTEYVIRHKGAPHLRSAAVDMPWYQYYLLDVIAFCLTVLMSAIFVIYYTLRSALRIIVPTKTTKFKSS